LRLKPWQAEMVAGVRYFSLLALLSGRTAPRISREKASSCRRKKSLASPAFVLPGLTRLALPTPVAVRRPEFPEKQKNSRGLAGTEFCVQSGRLEGRIAEMVLGRGAGAQSRPGLNVIEV